MMRFGAGQQCTEQSVDLVAHACGAAEQADGADVLPKATRPARPVPPGCPRREPGWPPRAVCRRARLWPWLARPGFPANHRACPEPVASSREQRGRRVSSVAAACAPDCARGNARAPWPHNLSAEVERRLDGTHTQQYGADVGRGRRWRTWQRGRGAVERWRRWNRAGSPVDDAAPRRGRGVVVLCGLAIAIVAHGGLPLGARRPGRLLLLRGDCGAPAAVNAATIDGRGGPRWGGRPGRGGSATRRCGGHDRHYRCVQLRGGGRIVAGARRLLEREAQQRAGLRRRRDGVRRKHAAAAVRATHTQNRRRVRARCLRVVGAHRRRLRRRRRAHRLHQSRRGERQR